jgi:hypothetical protein
MIKIRLSLAAINLTTSETKAKTKQKQNLKSSTKMQELQQEKQCRYKVQVHVARAHIIFMTQPSGIRVGP